MYSLVPDKYINNNNNKDVRMRKSDGYYQM